MSERTYTEAQIKAAFWRAFHKAGELWFDYIGSTEAVNEESTDGHWQDFREALEAEAR